MASRTLQLIIEVKDGAQKAFKDISNLGQSLTFLNFGFQSLQGIATGAFQAVAGQAIALQTQILALQGTFSSLNDISIGGKQLTDPLEKILALKQPVEAAIAEIRKISLEVSGVTSSDLIGVFQTIATNASSANLSLTDSVNLTKGFTAGLVSANIPLFQQRQEIASILRGTIDRNSILAQQLNITNEQVKVEKARGTLVEFLNKKLEGAIASQAELAKTFPGVTSNIAELFQNIQLSVGKPILEPVVAQLNVFYEFLKPLQPQIERVLVAAANGFVELGAKIGEIATALQPLAVQLLEFNSTIGAGLRDGAIVAINVLVESLKLAAATISTVLSPILSALNSDFGKVVVSTGAFALALGAATEAVIAFAAVGFPAILAGIGTSLVSVVTGLTVFGTVVTSGVAGIGAATGAVALLAGGLATLAIGLTAVTFGLIKGTQDNKNYVASIEALTGISNNLLDANLAISNSLDQLNRKQRAGIELTEAEKAKKKELEFQLKQNAIAIDAEIARLKEETKGNADLAAVLAPTIALLEKRKNAVQNTEIEAKKVEDVGNAYEQQTAKIQENIKKLAEATGSQAALNSAAKDLIKDTQAALEQGTISADQARTNFALVASNIKLGKEEQIKGLEAITASYGTETKKQAESIKTRTQEIQASAKAGEISERDAAAEISKINIDLTKLKISNLEKAREEQLKIVSKTESDTLKIRIEAANKAESDLATAQAAFAASGSLVDREIVQQKINIANAANEDLLKTEEKYQGLRNELERKSNNEIGAARAELSTAIAAEAEKQLKIQSEILVREIERSASERSRIETETEKQIQQLRLTGFESEAQLDAIRLERRRASNQEQIAEVERRIAKEQELLAAIPEGATEKREAQEKKVNDLINQRANLEKAAGEIEIQALQGIIKLRKAEDDRRISALQTISSLLGAQDSLAKAQLDFSKAQSDLAIAQSESKLSVLNQALKLQEQSLTAEQKIAQEQEKAGLKDAIANEKRLFAIEELSRLGIAEGASRVQIAQAIRTEEIETAALKARGFEASQAAAIAEFEVKTRIALVERQIAETKARSELAIANLGNNEELKAAAQLRLGFEQQISSLTLERIGIEGQSLKIKQEQDLILFNTKEKTERIASVNKQIEEGLGRGTIGLEGQARATKDIAGNFNTIDSVVKTLVGSIDQSTESGKKLAQSILGAGDTIKGLKTGFDELPAKATEKGTEAAKNLTASIQLELADGRKFTVFQNAPAQATIDGQATGANFKSAIQLELEGKAPINIFDGVRQSAAASGTETGINFKAGLAAQFGEGVTKEALFGQLISVSEAAGQESANQVKVGFTSTTTGSNSLSSIIFDPVKDQALAAGNTIGKTLAAGIKQAADQAIADAKAKSDKAAEEARSKAGNILQGNGVKVKDDLFNGAGSFGGNTLDYLRDAAKRPEGFSNGVIFNDKSGNPIAPDQVARDAIKAFGGTAEALAEITGVVGDLDYQATVIADRVKQNYIANGLKVSGNADFRDLRSRATGGNVFAPIALAKGGRTASTTIPQVYEVNEQGQESYTNYSTGETSLIKGGRQFTTFPADGYVNNANDTKKLFGSRAFGGSASANTQAEPPQNPALSKGFGDIKSAIARRNALSASNTKAIGSQSSDQANLDISYQTFGAMVLKVLSQADKIIKDGGDRDQLAEIAKPLAEAVKAGSPRVPQETIQLFNAYQDAIAQALQSAQPRAIGGGVNGEISARFRISESGNTEAAFARLNPEVGNSEENFNKLNSEVKKSTAIFTEQSAIASQFGQVLASTSNQVSGDSPVTRTLPNGIALDQFNNVLVQGRRIDGAASSRSGSSRKKGFSSFATGGDFNGFLTQGVNGGLNKSALDQLALIDSEVNYLKNQLSSGIQTQGNYAGSYIGFTGQPLNSSDLNKRLKELESKGRQVSQSSGSQTLRRERSTKGNEINPNRENSFIAGEEGQELITLDGKGGARIYNNSETKQLLGVDQFADGGIFQYGMGARLYNVSSFASGGTFNSGINSLPANNASIAIAPQSSNKPNNSDVVAAIADLKGTLLAGVNNPKMKPVNIDNLNINEAATQSKSDLLSDILAAQLSVI